MALTGKHFRLSKEAKAMLATMDDKVARNHFKRMMIDAEHSYTVNRNKRPNREAAQAEK